MHDCKHTKRTDKRQTRLKNYFKEMSHTIPDVNKIQLPMLKSKTNKATEHSFSTCIHYHYYIVSIVTVIIKYYERS